MGEKSSYTRRRWCLPLSRAQFAACTAKNTRPFSRTERNSARLTRKSWARRPQIERGAFARANWKAGYASRAEFTNGHDSLDVYGRGGDVFAVKIQTPGKLFFVGSILVALAGCATSSTRESAPVVSMGSSTYSVTRQANNGFTRDTEKLKAEA